MSPIMRTKTRTLSELPQRQHVVYACLTLILQLAKPCEGCNSQSVGASLLCRACGHELAFERNAKFVPSRLALSLRNDTVLGDKIVPVQLFENPHGHQFEVMTFTKADVLKHFPAYKHFSWYPGYSWAIATCRTCHTHLGWAFQPSNWSRMVTDEEFEESEDTFLALITHRLLKEDFASSLVITPKSLRV